MIRWPSPACPPTSRGTTNYLDCGDPSLWGPTQEGEGGPGREGRKGNGEPGEWEGEKGRLGEEEEM